MTAPVSKEDWGALTEILDRATKKLPMKRLEPIKQSILEFISTAAMLELEDMADVGRKFNEFLVKTVAPGWDNEAVATLSFSIGALVEKMQMNEYGPAFSSGLDEVLLYLDFYEGEGGGEEAAPEAQEEVEIVEDAEKAEAIAIEQEGAPDDATPREEDLAAIAERDESEEILIIGDIDLPEPTMPLQEPIPVLAPEPAALAAASPVSLLDSDEVGYVIDINEEDGYVIDGVEWYREMLAADPSSMAFCLLAEELCSRRQWREAIDVCRKGLRFHPLHLRGRVLLGWALAEMGEAGAAREVLAEARRELEKNAILYRVLADMENEEGNSPEAERLMDLYHRMHSEQDYDSFSPSFFDGLPLEDATVAPPTPMTPPKTPVFEMKPSAPVSPPKESPVIGILSGMLERFASNREADVEKRTVFSPSDRSSIKEILRAALH